MLPLFQLLKLHAVPPEGLGARTSAAVRAVRRRRSRTARGNASAPSTGGAAAQFSEDYSVATNEGRHRHTAAHQRTEYSREIPQKGAVVRASLSRCDNNDLA